jgi:hypothetical protein
MYNPYPRHEFDDENIIFALGMVTFMIGAGVFLGLIFYLSANAKDFSILWTVLETYLGLGLVYAIFERFRAKTKWRLSTFITVTLLWLTMVGVKVLSRLKRVEL